MSSEEFYSGKQKNRRGATLVESLVALVVFAGFIGGASKLFLSQTQLSGTAQAHYVAANLAKNKIEMTQAFDFTERTDFDDTNSIVNAQGSIDPLGNYRISTTYDASVGGTNTVEVIVRVDIRDRKTLEFGTQYEEVRAYQTLHLKRDD